MAKQRYNLTEADRRKLKDTIRRVSGGRVSSRPTPTRRVPRSGGSGGRLQWGEVTTEIGPATPWSIVGSGEVQFKLNTDPSTNDGAVEAVENLWPLTFEVGYIVCCDRSFNPPRVVTGTCVPA